MAWTIEEVDEDRLILGVLGHLNDLAFILRIRVQIEDSQRELDVVHHGMDLNLVL